MVGQVADRVTVDPKVRQAFAAPEFPELLVSDPEQPREFLLGDCGPGQRFHLDFLPSRSWPSSKLGRWRAEPMVAVEGKVRDGRRSTAETWSSGFVAIGLATLWVADRDRVGVVAAQSSPARTRRIDRV